MCFIPEIRIYICLVFFNSLPQDGAVLQSKHLSELVPAEVDETLRDLQDVFLKNSTAEIKRFRERVVEYKNSFLVEKRCILTFSHACFIAFVEIIVHKLIKVLTFINIL